MAVIVANIITDVMDWLDEFSSNWWFLLIIFTVALLDSVIPIVPGETTVIAGGRNAVAGLAAADGRELWKAPVEGTRKQPYFITRRDREPLAFAGLWESWKDPDVTASGESPAPLLTCSILTTEAVGPMAEVHHRMPVLLGPDAWDAWLDESVTDREQVQGMVLPAPEDLLEMWPVSTAVNSVRNKGAELVDPVGPDTAAGPDGPPTLF